MSDYLGARLQIRGIVRPQRVEGGAAQSQTSGEPLLEVLRVVEPETGTIVFEARPIEEIAAGVEPATRPVPAPRPERAVAATEDADDAVERSAPAAPPAPANAAAAAADAQTASAAAAAPRAASEATATDGAAAPSPQPANAPLRADSTSSTEGRKDQ